MGQDYSCLVLMNWHHANDMNNAHYRVLWNAWEKCVKTKANTVMLVSWIRTTIKSVLGTRDEGDMAQAQQQVGNQGDSGNGGDNDGARSVVQYELDLEHHPRFGGSPWCVRGATQGGLKRKTIQVEEEVESNSESSSDDESSVESKDSNPLNQEFAAAADAPPTKKTGRKRRAPPSMKASVPVSQSTRNKKKSA